MSPARNSRARITREGPVCPSSQTPLLRVILPLLGGRVMHTALHMSPRCPQAVLKKADSKR